MGRSPPPRPTLAAMLSSPPARAPGPSPMSMRGRDSQGACLPLRRFQGQAKVSPAGARDDVLRKRSRFRRMHKRPRASIEISRARSRAACFLRWMAGDRSEAALVFLVQPGLEAGRRRARLGERLRVATESVRLEERRRTPSEPGRAGERARLWRARARFRRWGSTRGSLRRRRPGELLGPWPSAKGPLASRGSTAWPWAAAEKGAASSGCGDGATVGASARLACRRASG